MLGAYKMDLQQITEKKWPKPVLEFIFKLKFRRVSCSPLSAPPC